MVSLHCELAGRSFCDGSVFRTHAYEPFGTGVLLDVSALGHDPSQSSVLDVCLGL